MATADIASITRAQRVDLNGALDLDLETLEVGEGVRLALNC